MKSSHYTSNSATAKNKDEKKVKKATFLSSPSKALGSGAVKTFFKCPAIKKDGINAKRGQRL